MPSLLDQLTTADASDAARAIQTWADTANPRLDELLALVRLATALRERLTTFTIVHGPGGPITWRQYEHVLWSLGEGFRQVLKRHRSLRGNATLFKAIAALCADVAYRKGRESFTMLLGQYGGPGQAPTLLALLDDPEVEGHALFALRTLKARRSRSCEAPLGQWECMETGRGEEVHSPTLPERGCHLTTA